MVIDPAQAKTVFLAALEKSGPDRAAYLDAACGTDASLRRRVEAMLAAHDSSGELLDRSPAEMLAEARDVQKGPATVEEVLSFLAPPVRPDTLGRLGHYHVQAVVGKGGFGIVLKAFDEKLHRVVAIKVLDPELAVSAVARNRFIREARAAAAVSHEHVVAIHGIEEEHRPPYLVMQFVDGISLEEKLNRRGALGLREILRIGSQIACGLAAAHKQGLVHRDIKPANILLENGVERVKITDFGLARLSDDASVSQSGTVAGTPMFMSPEQATGESVDHRSDLFSLGSVLYLMAAGRPPFRAGTTLAVLKRVIDDEPTPVQQVNPEIPDWLAAIIARLHAKEAPARFQSAQELAELLGQHLAQVQQPEPARPAADRLTVPLDGDALRPGWTRLWQCTLAGVVIGAVVGLGLGITDPALVATIAMTDNPAWLGSDAEALVGLFQGALLGAFLGGLVGLAGLARWLLVLRTAWEIRSGRRSPSGVPALRPALTPGGRRFAWSTLLPIAAGVFVVVAVLFAKYTRHGESARAPKSAPVVTDRDRLQGFWTLESAAMNGLPVETVPPDKLEVTLQFQGDELTVSRTNGQSQEGIFVLDETARPRTIDLMGSNGRGLYIYRLEGERLVLCIGEERVRPTDFSSKGGRQLLVFKRAP
jgi:uncharacterized protein (TIGR03067 family)